MKRVFVQVLGPTSASVDGRLIDIGSERQRRLLAALTLDSGATVSADQLVDRVWADGELPDDPRRALRTNLTRLRQALGGVEAIETTASGWRLDTAIVDIDARRFDELAGSTLDVDPSGRGELARLEEALRLWRGDAYQEVAGEDWIAVEAARLDELRLATMERQYQAMLDAGLHTDALPGLAAAASAYPLRDKLVRLRMLALYRNGRQAEAARVFQEHRRALIEMGLEPSPELVELDRRILAGDPSLASTPQGWTGLHSYRLGDQLGEGAFAVVYRGIQPSLSREVAVKVIRAELANRPEFVRRFEVEADLVAHLEHPHIVPLYDYWREPDRACLVFRYLRGGNLESRLTSRGPLTLAACATMVDQVGGALAAAHAAGVVHRDVKPANVFLDEAENFYLGDFGIALTASELDDPTAVLSAGSPAYAAPEQLRREPIGPAADVHGLGISLYEALTGRLPFPDAAGQASLLHHQLHDPIPSICDVRPDLPRPVDEVIARATAKRPDDRYQSVEELVAAFRAAIDATEKYHRLDATSTLVAAAQERNPYKGLRSFAEVDAGDFYGRERLVDRLVEMMSRTGTRGGIAAVVGPSGIGKSSVVRAGLLPRLRRGAVPGSERWFVATMMPGHDPFDELAVALLRVATSVPDNLLGQLAADTRGIARVVKSLVPEGDDAEVVLVIDQFEELFTLSPRPQTIRFLDALQHALTDARCPLRVIVTIRADFWDRPLRHGQFSSLIEGSTINVTALAPDELERAIVAPAHAVGAEFEPGLVSQLVADVADEPGALPMLQYALTELYDRRVSGLLTRAAYDAIGGLTGALATRADELFEAASPEEQRVCRRIFGRLVAPGEGAEDTRRRAHLAEVATSSAAEAVIDRFGQARMLSFDHDPMTREPTVEIAHEALIREWPRLRRWLDDDREQLREHRRLTAAAAAWRAAGDDSSELYRGGRLEAAESLLSHDDLTAVEGMFLDRSIELRAAEAAAEATRLRRLRRLVVGLAAVAVVALIAGAVAAVQWNRADDESRAAEELATEAAAARDDAVEQATIAGQARDEADASADEAVEQTQIAELARADAEAANNQADLDRLRSTAIGQVVNNPTLGLLLAAEAYRIDPGLEGADTLHRVLTATDGLEATMSGGYSQLALADDGSLAVAVAAAGIDVWDLTSRTLIRTLDRELRFGSRTDISGQGGLVAVSDVDGTHIVSIDSGATLFGDDREFERLSFSADGRELALIADDGTIEIWNLDDPARPLVTETMDGYVNIAWHPDGTSYALVRTDGTLEYRDRGAEVPRWIYAGPAGSGGPSIFSSDGANLVIALGQFPTSVIAFSVADGAVVGGPMTHPNGVLDLYWMDEAALRVAAAINSADLEAWDLVTGEDIEPPIAARRAWSLEYSEALDRIVETGTSGLRLWRPLGASPLERIIRPAPEQLVDGPDPWIFPAISSDGSRLLTSALTSNFPLPPVIAYDLNDDEPVGEALDVEAVVASDGDYTLLINDHLTVIDENLQPVGVPIPNPGDIQFFSVSPDGSTFTIHRWSVGARVLYRTNDGSAVELKLPGATDPTGVLDVGYSADGEQISAFALDGSDAWAIYDTATGEVRAEGGPADFIRPYLAGNTLYVSNPGYRDFTLRRLDPTTFESVGPDLVGHVSAVSWVSDDGVSRFIATSDFNGTVRVWDRATGTQVGREIDADGSMQLVGDGKVLMVLRPDGVAIWNYDTETWFDVACQAAGRNLTEDEWDEFGPRTFDRRATCPDFALE